jgi:hypothetical protein
MTAQFGYSASRRKMLHECPRKLYLYAYKSWNGWRRNGKIIKEDAAPFYIAKHRDNKYTWVGRIVHDVVADAIKAARNGRVPKDMEQAHERMVCAANAMIDKGFAQMLSGTPIFNPKTRVSLVEQLRGDTISPDYIRDEVMGRLEGLCLSPWEGDAGSANFLRAALLHPRVVVNSETLQTFWHENVACWVKMDLVLRSPKNKTRCIIVDWKTGKQRDSDEAQLELYGKWARTMGWDEVVLVLVYVDKSGRVTTKRADGGNHSFQEDFTNYVDDMRTRIANQDLRANIPIGRAFQAKPEVLKCRRCEFQDVCSRSAANEV